MIQHFESVFVEKIPQPRFSIGTRVVIDENWGIITGIAFYGLNSHPEQAWRATWEYQVSLDINSPDWYLLDGQDWYSEASVVAALYQQSDSELGLDSQTSGNGLAELCQLSI